MRLLEIVGRVAVVYVVLLTLLRLGGKKELAQMTPMDLLTMLLLSETVQQAMIGDDQTLAGGLTASAALIALALLSGWLAYRFRWFERVVEGKASVLIEDGEIRERVRRSYRLTDDQLATALHRENLAGVEEVEKAFIEPTGEISFIKKKPA